MRCLKFPSGRTSIGDYRHWKSHKHFKTGAVDITINFTILVLQFLCSVGGLGTVYVVNHE